MADCLGVVLDNSISWLIRPPCPFSRLILLLFFSLCAASLGALLLQDGLPFFTEFKDIERLDLAFNSLTSLEGLEECVNLKWLSVKQNKLQSLKGIEGLTMLAVLDAGKNKLTSIDEVKHLASLRALILNGEGALSSLVLCSKKLAYKFRVLKIVLELFPCVYINS